ncbi:MAG: hypothetical protein R6W90_04755 [Ignavibacteriaceae bacterium]
MILSITIDVFVIIFLFAVFGYLHSILASNRIKRIVIERFGSKIAFYRLFYNAFALLFFIIIYDLMPKPALMIYDLPYPYDFIVIIPQLLGLAGLIVTSRYFSLKEFLGIGQIIRWKKGTYNISELDERLTLRIAGPYRYTRHPVYFFFIIFLLFRPAMDLFYLVFLICIVGYFYAGSLYEEKKLRELFGRRYDDYAAHVPGIIPYKFLYPYKSIQ